MSTDLERVPDPWRGGHSNSCIGDGIADLDVCGMDEERGQEGQGKGLGGHFLLAVPLPDDGSELHGELQSRHHLLNLVCGGWREATLVLA